jgi:TatA/E family protein of Tat protein translocase
MNWQSMESTYIYLFQLTFYELKRKYSLLQSNLRPGIFRMFGIGLTEILLILVVALLVVGPKKLPELARSLGRGLAEFRKTADEFKESIYADDDTAPNQTEARQKTVRVEKIVYPEDPPVSEASATQSVAEANSDPAVAPPSEQPEEVSGSPK